MGFDLPACSPKVGIGTDIAGGGPGRPSSVDPGEAGVDAVGRDQGVDLGEVGGREAQSRTRPAPWATMPRIRCGRPRNRAASSTRPSHKHSADQRRRDQSPSMRVPSTTSKSIPASSHHSPRIETFPCRSCPNAKFGPSTIPRAEAGRRMTRSKNSRADSSSSHGPVWKTPTSVAPGLVKQGDLALGPDQRDRGLVRPQQGDRMGVEREGERGDPGRVGPGPEPAQQTLVAPMDPIEVTDRDVSASSPDGEITNVLDARFVQRLSASQIRSPSQPTDRNAPKCVAPPGRRLSPVTDTMVNPARRLTCRGLGSLENGVVLAHSAFFAGSPGSFLPERESSFAVPAGLNPNSFKIAWPGSPSTNLVNASASAVRCVAATIPSACTIGS